MPNIVDTPYLGEIILWEEEVRYSRSVGTLIAGQKLAAGSVLGLITASGKLTQLAPAAVDGSQTAVGVLVFPVDASATGTNADTAAVYLARISIVKDTGLVYPGGITGPQKIAANSQLQTAGILIRPSV